MNKKLVAKELLKIAKSIVGTEIEDVAYNTIKNNLKEIHNNLVVVSRITDKERFVTAWKTLMNHVNQIEGVVAEMETTSTQRETERYIGM